MKKHIIFIILVTLFVNLVLVGKALYQESQEFGSEKLDVSTDLLKVVKEIGWKMPKIDSNETFQSKIVHFQNIPVLAKTYQLKKPFDSFVDFYYLNKEKTLEIESLTLEIRYFQLYSFKEKVFAFAVFGSPFGFTKGGSRAVIGTRYKVYYFDENGDGKFETRYNDVSVPKHIPDWVKK